MVIHDHVYGTGAANKSMMYREAVSSQLQNAREVKSDMDTAF